MTIAVSTNKDVRSILASESFHVESDIRSELQALSEPLDWLFCKHDLKHFQQFFTFKRLGKKVLTADLVALRDLAGLNRAR
jgi:hypothetical protein